MGLGLAASLAVVGCGGDTDHDDKGSPAKEGVTSGATTGATTDAPTCIGTSEETERSYDEALAAATDGCVIGDLGGDSAGSTSFDWGSSCTDRSIQVWRHAGDGEDTEPYAWVRVAPGQTAEVQSEPADSSRFYMDEECRGDIEDLVGQEGTETNASAEPPEETDSTAVGSTPASRTCNQLNDYDSIEVERDYPMLADETDSSELASALRAYVDAWRDGDYDALLSVWVDDLTDLCAAAGVELRQD